MYPICPNCGNEQQEAMSNCDSGFPDYNDGSICNDCGACVLSDQWEYEDDDEFERERKEDIERAGRMFQQDEVEESIAERPGVNLGVIEDMESTLVPDDHTVKARGVWLMDGDQASIFYEGSALGSVQHELSCLKDEIRKLSDVGALFDGCDELNEFTLEENNKKLEWALDEIYKLVTRKGRYTSNDE